MTALVTGASGFAGSHLVEYLLDKEYSVTAMISPSASPAFLPATHKRVAIKRADLRDGKAVHNLIADCRPERIYHLASISTKVGFGDQPRLFHDVIFNGTLNILYALRELALECRLLYVSSSEVYGAEPDDVMPLVETQPYRPNTPYATHKAAAELACYQFFRTYGIQVVRVRPFPHTGPRQGPTFVCSSMAKQIAEIQLGLRPAEIVVGNTSPRRDFTDVRDVVRGYHALLEAGEAGDVYQLCSGRPVSIASILKFLIDSNKIEISVITDPSRVRSNEIDSYWGDASKITAVTGWTPEIPLATTLRDLLHYWISRPLHEQ
ncbi:MAG TPA: GDP-mannose 4,6-dehydratase [Bryobacteraceae bacterium]|jgi:GDP-4-dehydro-6-deoxy-D-mannose reductase